MRGGAWNNHQDNARCAYRNRNQPDNRNNNLGFRLVLRSSHVLPPLLLVMLFYFRAWRRDSTTVLIAFQQCRLIRLSGFVCRGEGRRTAPDRSGPRTVKAIRGIACAGHIHKLSHGQAFVPAVARPLFRLYRGC